MAGGGLPATRARACCLAHRAAHPVFGATKPGATDAKPLPPEQAFGFEAIAGDGNTPAAAVHPGAGLLPLSRPHHAEAGRRARYRRGRAALAEGTQHHDEHFGDVVVYFDQIDVPLPLRRTNADAANATLVATFQGCQTDGICYPPMTRRVAVEIPRGRWRHPSWSAREPVLPESASTSVAATASAAGVVAAPTTTDAANPARTSTSHRPPTAGDRLALASLLLALLGGLVLNLMPCVLPVLSLKAVSLANSGEKPDARARMRFGTPPGAGRVRRARRARAGLARRAGAGLGFPAAATAGGRGNRAAAVRARPEPVRRVVPNVGIGARGNVAWMQKHGVAGDFATGVLAVVLATPVHRSFMGAALAHAFAGPATGGMLVFLALGPGWRIAVPADRLRARGSRSACRKPARGWKRSSS